MPDCKICGENYDNLIGLSTHLQVTHSISSREYTLRYFYNDETPKCKCGCKNEVNFDKLGHFKDYKSGHNSKDKNPFGGESHTKESRQKISRSKKEWFEENEHHAKQNIKVNCNFCGEQFNTNLYKLENQENLFCSRECYGNFMSDHIKRESSLGSILKERLSKAGSKGATGCRDNNLEKKVEKIIQGGNFEYKKQVNVNGFIVDFVLENQLVLEVYGDYWHCNPDFYNENYYHKQIGKNAEDIWRENEKRINRVKKSTYNVKVVWENDIRNSEERVLENLNELLN